MKNYRNIIAIALVLLLAVSVYSMVTDSTKKEKQLKQYLQEAQGYVDEGLVAKAVEKYSQAIAIDDNVEYYNLIADLYFNNDETENSITWSEQTMKSFPEDTSGYLRAIRGYLAEEMYTSAFETLETYDGRGLHLEEIETYRNEMMSLHFLRYVSIEDVAQQSGGYSAIFKKDKWGLLTNKGSTAIKSEFKHIGYFANDVVAICTQEDEWFFAGSDGHYLSNISTHIEGNIVEVGLYNENVFPVNNGEKYQYYDMEFSPCIGSFDYAGAFNNGVAAVKNGNSWSLIDKDGQQIGNQTYEDIVVDHRGVCCTQNRIIVKTNGKYVLLDATGKQISKQQYDAALLPASSELFAVKVGSKWGFANLDGDIIIEPQYDDAKAFSNGFGAVCTDGMWGYVDNKNVLQIEQIYLDCRNMTSAGTAFVKNETGWYMLKLYSENY